MWTYNSHLVQSFIFFVLFVILLFFFFFFFFFSSRRRHTRSKRDWSSDVCSSDLCFSHMAWIPLNHEGHAPYSFTNCILSNGQYIKSVLPTIRSILTKPTCGERLSVESARLSPRTST